MDNPNSWLPLSSQFLSFPQHLRLTWPVSNKNLSNPGARPATILRKFGFWLPLLAELEMTHLLAQSWRAPFLLVPNWDKIPLILKQGIKTLTSVLFSTHQKKKKQTNKPSTHFRTLDRNRCKQIKFFLFPNHFLLFFRPKPTLDLLAQENFTCLFISISKNTLSYSQSPSAAFCWHPVGFPPPHTQGSQGLCWKDHLAGSEGT